MSLLGIIPARGGSKGIPRKNIRPLAGRPLLQWTVDAAHASGRLDRLIVSTEDEEIAAVAEAGGAEVPFLRPPELAADDTPGFNPVLHALDHLPQHDWVLLLQPTSPLRSSEDIAGILDFCREHDSPSAVSVTEVAKPPHWMFYRDEHSRLAPILPGDRPTRRQDLPPTYALNGALYLARADWLRETRAFVGPETLGYVMPAERSYDLDTEEDWRWVEWVVSNDVSL